jgi:anaerobic selenocysteine-containing dehydrogenase
LDCPDTCSLTVTVEDGRLVGVGAAPGNPVTAGWICRKVKHHARRVYAPERVLTPLVRTGPKGEGSFRPASWDDALDLVAGRLSDAIAVHGPASVLPYVYNSSAGALTSAGLTALLFARLRVPAVAHTICAATAGRAWDDTFGDMLSADPLDVPHARLVVVWGANPTVSNTHLLPLITEATRNGATLVVVDPRRTGVAQRADLHLAIRPGTDVVLAYALARLLDERGAVDEAFCAEHASGVEEFLDAAAEWTVERAAAVCGLETEDISSLATLIATHRPALLRIGWGPERNRNGGSASLAILALPAVAGKFGVRGGGYTMSNSASWAITRTWIGSKEPATRVINMNQLGRALEDSDRPVKVLFVYNNNAAVTSPDQRRILRGLERDDLFTVVFEQVMTDTARYADIVLPATTFLEGYEIARSYGTLSLRLGKPVVEAAGESRSNAEVFGALLERLELRHDGEPTGELEEMLAVLAQLPQPLGAELSERGAATPPHSGRPIQFLDVWPLTPDRKVNLFSEELDAEAPEGLYAYQADPGTTAFPLTLISPASERTISSTLAELPRPEVRLLMHPDDAAARGLIDGDAIRMFNALGEVRCSVTVGAWIRPGTVSLPKGLWRRHTVNGYTANALVPDSLTDIGGGACFNDARVQVERATVVAGDLYRGFRFAVAWF